MRTTYIYIYINEKSLNVCIKRAVSPFSFKEREKYMNRNISSKHREIRYYTATLYRVA